MTGPAHPTAAAPPQACSRRAGWIVLAFLLWAVVLVLRLAQLMVLDRDRYLHEMERESWREFVVPAPRGRILDRNGVPLAWSERQFRLVYRVPETVAAIVGDFGAFRGRFPGVPLPQAESLLVAAGEEVRVIPRLDSPMAARVTADLPEPSRFRVESHFVRKYYPNARLQRRLGRVSEFEGELVGASGEERRYDHRLRGVAGRYRVMVDKNGAWIPSTWEKLRDLRPGYDVHLNIAVSREATSR